MILILLNSLKVHTISNFYPLDFVLKYFKILRQKIIKSHYLGKIKKRRLYRVAGLCVTVQLGTKFTALPAGQVTTNLSCSAGRTQFTRPKMDIL